MIWQQKYHPLYIIEKSIIQNHIKFVSTKDSKKKTETTRQTRLNQPLMRSFSKNKDTADRINGLERPKPNEGYALRNGTFNNIKDSEFEIVKHKKLCPQQTVALRRLL